MKSNKVTPLSFSEALDIQEHLLKPGRLIVGTPKGDYDLPLKEEVIRLRKHAFRWQAAFSLTAVLAIWLIAMRFV